jgi:hypothetical protein
VNVVRCVRCGQPHVAVSATVARAEVAAVAAQQQRLGETVTADVEHYLRCSRCRATDGFVDGELMVDELHMTMMACVVVGRAETCKPRLLGGSRM